MQIVFAPRKVIPNLTPLNSQHFFYFRDAGMSAELRALAIVFGSDPKNDDDFKFLWKKYVNTPLDAERRYIMKAFSRVKDKKKLQM